MHYWRLTGFSHFLALIGSTTVVATAIPAQCDDGAIKKDFFLSAPAGWRAIDEFTVGRKIRIDEEVQWEGESKRRHASHQFNGDGKNLQYIGESEAEEQGEHTTLWYTACVNSDYSFILTKDSPSEPWKIRHVEDNGNRVLTELGKRQIASPGTMVYLESITAIVDNPRFNLVEITPVTGNRLVQVEFTMTKEEGGSATDRSPKLQSGRIVFSPEHHWAIQEFEVLIDFFDGAGLIESKAEYDGVEKGFLIPVRQVLDVKDEDGQILIHRVLQYEEFTAGSVLPSECRLPAFGLPEVGHTERGILWVWNLIGVACLLLAFFLWRFYLRPT